MDAITPHLASSTSTLPLNSSTASRGPIHHASRENEEKSVGDVVDSSVSRPRVRMYVDLKLATPQSPPTKPLTNTTEGGDSSVPQSSPGPSNVKLGQSQQGKGATRVYLGTEDSLKKSTSTSSPTGVTVSVAKGGDDPQPTPCVRLLEELMDPGGGGMEWEKDKPGDGGKNGEDNSSEGLPEESLHLSHIHCTFLDDLLDGINKSASTQAQDISQDTFLDSSQITQTLPQQDTKPQNKQVAPQQEILQDKNPSDLQTNTTEIGQGAGEGCMTGQDAGSECIRGQGGKGEGNSNPYSRQQVQEFHNHPQRLQDTLSSQPNQEDSHNKDSQPHNKDPTPHIKDPIQHEHNSKLHTERPSTYNKDSPLHGKNLAPHNDSSQHNGSQLHNQDSKLQDSRSETTQQLTDEFESPKIVEEVVQFPTRIADGALQLKTAKEANWSCGERSEAVGVTEGMADVGLQRDYPPEDPQSNTVGPPSPPQDLQPPAYSPSQNPNPTSPPHGFLSESSPVQSPLKSSPADPPIFSSYSEPSPDIHSPSEYSPAQQCPPKSPAAKDASTPGQDSPPEPPPVQDSPPQPPPDPPPTQQEPPTHLDLPCEGEVGERERIGDVESNMGLEINSARSEDYEYEDDDEDDKRTGLAAAVSRVVRRSMRRMRRLRLSGRGQQAPSATSADSGGIGDVSEETQVRKGLPPAPPMGLSTVRSPAAASIIVSSLMAALSPPPHQPPRETLTPMHKENDASVTGDANRRRRRHSHPLHLDSTSPTDPISPTPPMSLEVEVGGCRSNVDDTGDSASTWEATFIPRPSFSPHSSTSQNSSTSHPHSHTNSSNTHANSTHPHSNPTHTHSNPPHTQSNPTHTHNNSSHTHSNPPHTHSNSSHTHSNPPHTHSNPPHTHSNPSLVDSNPPQSHSTIQSHTTSFLNNHPTTANPHTSHSTTSPPNLSHSHSRSSLHGQQSSNPTHSHSRSSSNPSHSRSSSHSRHPSQSNPTHYRSSSHPQHPTQSRSPAHSQSNPSRHTRSSSQSQHPSPNHSTNPSSPYHSLPDERERGRERGTREGREGSRGRDGEGERGRRNRNRSHSSTARNSINREDSSTSIATATTTLEDRNSAEINNNSRSRSRSHSRSRSRSRGANQTEINNNSRSSSRSRRPSGGNSRRTSQNNSRRNSQASNTSRRRGRSRSGSARNSPRPHVGSVRVGSWSHPHSGLMASLAVTLTTFNISRFAVLGARFGWPFVVQWCVVSAVLGLPLMTFHITLGQYLGAGVVDMWVLSPVFQGVGYSVLLGQALLGLYCCVPIAWLFIFFRDSFITHNNRFRWTDCRLMNCSTYSNLTTVIIEGVPKYFNTQVLQRGEGAGNASLLQELGTLKFDMAFNIALIWIITLLALSRGNQWYGKVSYVAALVPLLCYLVVCLYLAAGTKDDLYMNDVTNFSEFFMNSRSWMAASREVFLVWGLHSAVLQQMAAHNKRGHALYRDTTLLWVVTSLALVLAAVTGSSCVAGLNHHDLKYKPSSFETSESAIFLAEARDEGKTMFEAFMKRLQLGHIRTQEEYLHHDNFYAGIRIRPPRLRPGDDIEEDRSGYQSLRLATELFPALLAVNGAKEISPFWSSLFYLSLLLFGIAQQLAVWRTIVEAVISFKRETLQGWETFITFLCCLFGFSAALPMATGAGIHILYFLDYAVSCGWWLMIIQLVQIFALLFVRGKPYSGQDIVSELLGREGGCGWLWLGPLTSFSWNIIVPVGLLVLSISSFKSGQYREVFSWGGDDGYWPVWACQLSAAIQLFPILLVPLVGLAQTCRYLASSDDDLFDRIQRLYRPTLRSPYSLGRHAFLSTSESDLVERGGAVDGGDESGDNHLPLPYSDPPPKYTPPPSYSTATGARLAKMLNQGVRQSMRRLRASFRSAAATTTPTATDSEVTGGDQSGGAGSRPYIPPPDYVTATGSNNYDPPQYATLDPLRRQRALAVLSGLKVEDQSNNAGPSSPTSSGLQRNNSLRGSGFGRSIASGVRRSARRLAATLGVGGAEDGTALVVSEATPSQSNTGNTGSNQDSQPYVYTNIELVSHSYA